MDVNLLPLWGLIKLGISFPKATHAQLGGEIYSVKERAGAP